ncbi:Vegetative incompatibility protein HET-E-1 [Cladobotryum mycophilum]|uniref:Vegetative incompatibility protein HET-E-1 n=1 Tax=Cladobotryum mycophilum TaxID=491253 RepID=A0ABR0SS81_9HYPO
MEDMSAIAFNGPIQGQNVVAGVNVSAGGIFNAIFNSPPLLSLAEECLKALRLTDPRDDKKRIQQAKGDLLRDSYHWIINHNDFKRLCDDSECRLLWIRGDPGKGKTMLLCGIIDEMEKPDEMKKLAVYRLAYFFCQATEPRLRSANAVVRGLIYSLVVQQPSLVSHVQEKYKQAGKSVFEDGNAWAALSEMLIAMLNDKSLGNVVLCIDALDECTEELPRLLDFITRASSSSPAKWIVSSRNLLNIEEMLGTTGLDSTRQKVSICLELNNDAISVAVRNYIRYKVQLLTERKNYDVETRSVVEQYLIANANDTFLWVALVYDELADPNVRRRHTRAKLESFAPGLDSIYGRMIKEIGKSADADVCKQILAIVSIVYRPITLMELRYLVGSLEMYDDEDVKELIALCGSFLALREGVIYLVHQSAKDFLFTKKPDAIFSSGVEDAHHIIFSRSLRGLSSTLRRDIYNLHDPGFSISNLRVPNPDPLAAVAYSCLYWAEHLHDANTSGSRALESVLPDIDAVYSFLEKNYLYWLEALGLLRDVSKGVIAIQKLRNLLTHIKSPQLGDLLRDAHRFILSHISMIEAAPLQVYVSALLFSPTGSLVRRLFKEEEAKWIVLRPGMEADWNACLQTLEGHSDMVRSIAFSVDNKLVSGSSDGTVRIWDATTGSCIRTINGHSNWVTSVAFSANGQRIASGSRDETIKIWDAAHGTCFQILQGHSGLITEVIFSPENKRLASASGDDTIRIWDIARGICLQTLHGHRSLVTSIDFSTDGQRLASGSYDNTVKIWDTAISACLKTLKGHESFVTTVAFSIDNQRVASGADDRAIKIWDLGLGVCLQTLKGHTAMISSLVFSVDGRQFASGSYDNTVKIWDTGGCVQTLEGHSNFVTSVAFSTDGQRIASGSRDKTIKIWDIGIGDSFQKTIESHKGSVTSTVFSDDGLRLGTGSWDNAVKIWDTATGLCLETLEGHDHLVTSIAFSADQRIASGSYDHKIKIWKAGVCLQTLEGHTSFVTSVAFSADTCGQRLASGSDDQTIKIWDTTTGACLQTLTGHGGPLSSVAFSADQGVQRIASGSDDRTVKIWDAVTGVCLQTINVNWRMTQLSFDPTTNSRLYTNIGLLDLNLVPLDTPSSAVVHLQPISGHDYSGYSSYSIGVNGRWIVKSGRPIVWLPSSYKASSSVARGSMIAVGCETGHVLTMQFSE